MSSKMSKWGKAVLTAAIVSSLMTAESVVFAEDAADAEPTSEQAAASLETVYTLTETLQAEIKSLLNEKTSGGVRIGAVVRLINNEGKVVRVPDYEIRVKTDEGIEYTLQPSAANARSIQPKSKVELSYMTVIDRQDAVKINELSWVDVDWYVYPKKETPMLAVPVAGLSWGQDKVTVSEPAALKKWRDSFQLKSVQSPLVFTPISMSRDYSGQRPAEVVKVLVDNKSPFRETVPDFSIQGRDKSKEYDGRRIEQGDITLEPGEKKYIHFAITTDQDTQLLYLNVVTPESFVQTDVRGQVAPLRYTVGRVSILLPSEFQATDDFAVAYNMGEPIRLDPVNIVVHPDVKVALINLSMHDSEGVGYKTAVAKFKLTNNSTESIPLPDLQTEMKSADGYSYSGTRQVNVPQRLMPGLSHIVTYSYIVPDSETGQDLTLKLLDGVTAVPFTSSLAALKVSAAEQPVTNVASASELSFYPYKVKINYWVVSGMTNVLTALNPVLSYSYKLKIGLDIAQEDKVVVDQNFSMMKVALVDEQGRTLAEENLSFVNNTAGARKLVSGETVVTFNNVRTEQLENHLSINIYETITTPNGEAKRLVASFKQ